MNRHPDFLRWLLSSAWHPKCTRRRERLKSGSSFVVIWTSSSFLSPVRLASVIVFHNVGVGIVRSDTTRAFCGYFSSTYLVLFCPDLKGRDPFKAQWEWVAVFVADSKSAPSDFLLCFLLFLSPFFFRVRSHLKTQWRFIVHSLVFHEKEKRKEDRGYTSDDQQASDRWIMAEHWISTDARNRKGYLHGFAFR